MKKPMLCQVFVVNPNPHRYFQSKGDSIIGEKTFYEMFEIVSLALNRSEGG
jgi:hypothetical protein